VADGRRHHTDPVVFAIPFESAIRR